jgi:D-beta-D-heptose 7-phosphate kinase/D-beta-D-heptose 1-phosphate adenosyltransferase
MNRKSPVRGGEKNGSAARVVGNGRKDEARGRSTGAGSPLRLATEAKVLTIARARTLRQQARRGGRKVVFTNGCFDLLHAGHVQYLEAARRQGDLLIVGLNCDASVRRLKGKGRPIQGERDRALLVAALAAVDGVVIFEEDTPARIIEALDPDVLAKGADWKASDIVGRDNVLARGGRVVRIPLRRGASTSTIIEKIVRTHRRAARAPSR